MTPTTQIRRFSVIERLFHFFLMITFMVQTATGFSRLYSVTVWGKKINAIFGGYETSLLIHIWVGGLMMAGFAIHTVYLLTRINWRTPVSSIFGPDSLVPNLTDLKDMKARIRWFFGLGPPPRFDRWAYWEKFDYWAVYWGLPLLAITGVMLIYPIAICRFLPGWSLNIAIILHKAEAILAVSYIFIVHFFIGHIRPASFPMNEAMFSGNMSLAAVHEEKPAWIDRLKKSGNTGLFIGSAPVSWYRVLYFVFGYVVLIFGVYLLINGIIYSGHVNLH